MQTGNGGKAPSIINGTINGDETLSNANKNEQSARSVEKN